MTVRWKPLLILSGLFLVIAVLGVIAMVYALVPRGSGDILPLARADRAAKQYDKALIHYQRALQKDGRNPAIHEELASMFAEWAAQSKGDAQAKLLNNLMDSLKAAADHGKKLKEPRRKLLAESMRRDLTGRSVFWSRELLKLEPKNSDAHYVLADEELEGASPRFAEIKRHLTELEAAKVSAVRLAWIKARLAEKMNDESELRRILADSRGITLATTADPVDQTALLRLRALDVRSMADDPVTVDPVELSGRVEALQKDLKVLLSGPAPAPTRITRLSLLLEQVQKTLTVLASNADAKSKPMIDKLVDGIEEDVETLFKKSLEGSSPSDLHIYLTYADHLRFRQKREQCLKVVKDALESPVATKPTMTETVLGLRAVAAEAALSQSDAPDRLEQAEPHIKELIGSSLKRYQGLGHLFQGAIELEQSGVAGPAAQGSNGKIVQAAKKGPELSSASQQKLRVSALNHLKIAATLLPEVAEAQARYGVALVLSLEQALGRQYLQNALRLKNLDPQYQVWAAWSMVQAGYPEEAEPIVTQLLEQIAKGKQSRELEGTLHLLNGEIHQARHGTEDLRKALVEYEKSTRSGASPTPAVQLRLAQIEVQLSRHDDALKRIDALRKANLGGPAAEHLAVLTLQDQKKDDKARTVLDAARKRFPESDELAGLDAAILLREKRAQDADKVLADFLKQYPDNVGVILMRAQVLADHLKNPQEARKLLINVADRSDNSAPFVQLALLDLKQQDYSAVTATIAKIRARWKEAAVADLLEAQLALDQSNLSEAIAHFDEALKKDPSNKLVQFWKAQLDSRNGATKDATSSFEAIAKAKPTKQINPGLSLMAAAESALASIAMESGDIDGAIHRLENLRKQSGPINQSGGLTRADRWQLASAYAAKSQLALAKREITALLKEPAATDDERVRAANFYRLHNEDEAALVLLDQVIKANPAHPAAVVTRAAILTTAKEKRYDEAAALVQTAIQASKDDPPPVFFLMLAAIKAQAPADQDGAKLAMEVLDAGLKAQPNSHELVQAKYKVLSMIRGDKKEAVAFVESKAKGGSGALQRLLVEVYRDQKDYAGAERVLRSLLTENPKDTQVAANLVRIVAIQAVDAAERDRHDEEKLFSDKAAGLIREFRQKFPNDLAFLQAECDLAARRGNLARALEVTQEMDKISKASPIGPQTRGRILTAQGRLREAATAYQEAIQRNPRQLDIRLALAQLSLRLDEIDETFNQSKFILDIDHDQPDAILLQAQALAARKGTRTQETAGRNKAVEVLSAAIQKNPKFAEAYHLKADILFRGGDRDRGLATLRECRRALPDDAAGIAQLIQHLCEHRPKGPTPTDLAEADTVASGSGDADKRGNLMLAIAVGFHKSGELERALPWARKAATKLNTPLVHLNYGDLLLSMAEGTEDQDKAKEYFKQAVDQYDQVLKVQANSIEAINNKAWILHSHLDQNRAALELTQAFVKRVDPATLPGEFFDTMGSIQESLGKSQDAEESYRKGLTKSVNHPVLNYHMGKLIAKDRARVSKASTYLEKAHAGRDRLSPTMAKDLETLLKKPMGAN